MGEIKTMNVQSQENQDGTKYNLVILDFPHTYEKSGGIKSSRGLAKKFYKTMTKTELLEMDIKHEFADDCYIFAWTTGTKIRETIEIIEGWGFDYFGIVFTWIKRNKKSDSLFWGMGAETRANPEYVILMKRGKLKRLSASVHSVIVSKVGRHSAKPMELHKRIEELHGKLPRKEYFARYRVQGWDAHGNQLEDETRQIRFVH